jgi:uncharacterized protein YggE
MLAALAPRSASAQSPAPSCTSASPTSVPSTSVTSLLIDDRIGARLLVTVHGVAAMSPRTVVLSAFFKVHAHGLAAAASAADAMLAKVRDALRAQGADVSALSAQLRGLTPEADDVEREFDVAVPVALACYQAASSAATAAGGTVYTLVDEHPDVASLLADAPQRADAEARAYAAQHAVRLGAAATSSEAVHTEAVPGGVWDRLDVVVIYPVTKAGP